MLDFDYTQFLDQVIYKNSLQAWFIGLGIGVLTYLVLMTAKNVLHGRLKKLGEKTVNDVDDFIAELIGCTRGFLFFFIALYAATMALELPQSVQNLLETLPVLALLLQGALWGNRVIDFFLARYVKSRPTEEEQLTTQTMIGPFRMVLVGLSWSIFTLVALDNMGIDVTALIAGLGVGGVAIALATQNILGDVFAALSIVIDKPFVVGDFIVVGDMVGNVENIGLKTTRVRSLSGEQLVFSNSDLLSSRIRNFKRMFERRILFGFGVIYQTRLEQLNRIPEMVKDIIEGIDKTRFDRAHFKSYGDSSLDFEVVYYVLEPEYTLYMDIQQQINLELFKRFEAEGIEFAYPTRTLFVTHEDSETAEAVGAASE